MDAGNLSRLQERRAVSTGMPASSTDLDSGCRDTSGRKKDLRRRNLRKVPVIVAAFRAILLRQKSAFGSLNNRHILLIEIPAENRQDNDHKYAQTFTHIHKSTKNPTNSQYPIPCICSMLF